MNASRRETNRTNDDENEDEEDPDRHPFIDKIRTRNAEFGNSAPIGLDFRPLAERYCGSPNLRP